MNFQGVFAAAPGAGRRPGPEEARLRAHLPVSYTHLDVYKRQYPDGEKVPDLLAQPLRAAGKGHAPGGNAGGVWEGSPGRGVKRGRQQEILLHEVEGKFL